MERQNLFKGNSDEDLCVLGGLELTLFKVSALINTKNEIINQTNEQMKRLIAKFQQDKKLLFNQNEWEKNALSLKYEQEKKALVLRIEEEEKRLNLMHLQEKNKSIEDLNKKQTEIKDRNGQIRQLREKIEKQNIALGLSKNEQQKIEKKRDQINEVLRLLHGLMKSEAVQIPQAKQFTSKDIKFYIQQPKKLIDFYRIIGTHRKAPQSQSKNQKKKQSQLSQKIKGLQRSLQIYSEYIQELSQNIFFNPIHFGKQSPYDVVDLRPYDGPNIIYERMQQMYEMRKNEGLQFRQKKINNFQTQLKAQLCQYTEIIRNTFLNLKKSQDLADSENRPMFEKMRVRVLSLFEEVQQLKNKIKQGQNLLKKEKNQKSAIIKSLQTEKYNLKSFLMIANHENQRLNKKIEILKKNPLASLGENEQVD